MPNPVNGPTPALPTTGQGQQIGDGSLEVKLQNQGAPAAYAAAATLLAADLTAGLITLNNAGNQALTLPTGANLDAAIPNARVNSAFRFSVIATGAGTATVTTNTGWTLVGLMVVPAGNALQYIARKTGVGTWALYQTA